jgi:hypothetical protein
MSKLKMQTLPEQTGGKIWKKTINQAPTEINKKTKNNFK